MARNLRINDVVYVPATRVDGIEGHPVALYRSKVARIGQRKIRIVLPGGATSEWIGTSLVHKDVGVLILNLGDFQTERTLLDPLAKSILQFSRLLLPDDQILGVKVRSLRELQTLWRNEQASHSHVILTGHGTKDSIRFGVDGLVSIDEFAESLRIHGASSKTFISLCCNTGYKSFGGTLSRKAICNSFVAPFQEVHGAAASQFCQTFLAHHFLEGCTPGVAFNKARESVPGGTKFRLWQAGKVKTGPKRDS